MTCSVPSCKNVYRLLNPKDKISFHRFPRGERFNLYKSILGLPNLEASHRKYICSKHFLETDFYTKANKRYLKYNALPSQNLSKPKSFKATNCNEFNKIRKHQNDEINHVKTSIKYSVLPATNDNILSADNLEPMCEENGTILSRQMSNERLPFTTIVEDVEDTGVNSTDEDESDIESWKVEHWKNLVNEKTIYKLDSKIRSLQKIKGRLKQRAEYMTSLLNYLDKNNLLKPSAHKIIKAILKQ